jgi:hypothetical protein
MYVPKELLMALVLVLQEVNEIMKEITKDIQ